MKLEEQKTTALSTEVRQAPKEENRLLAAWREGWRRRSEHSGEIVVDLFAAALSCLLAMTHAAFGVYPFSLALLFSASARVLPIAVGAAVGCTFLGDVGVLYLVLHIGALLLRVFFSYPRTRGRLPESRALFSEDPALRVLLAAMLGLGMALYELILFGAVGYTLLFAGGAVLFLPAATLLFAFLTAQPWPLAAYLGKEPPPAFLWFGRHAAFLQMLGGVFFFFSVAFALRPYAFFGVSLSGCATAAATLFVSRRYGAAKGCVTGLLVGLAGNPVYLPAYGLLGLFSGLYSGIGMPLALGAAVLSGGGYAAYVGGLSGFLSVVPEMTVTSLLLFVPLKLLPAGAFPILSGRETERAPREQVTEEESIACLSTALRSVSDTLKEAAIKEKTPTPSEYERLCLAARERICRRCPAEGVCGESALVEDALRATVIRLSIGEEISEGAGTPCEGFGKMLEEIRTSAAHLAQRKRQGGAKGSLSADYALLSEMLDGVLARGETAKERDGAAEERLKETLAEHGITASEISVVGKRKKEVLLRGLRGENGRAVEGEWVEDACVRSCGRGVSALRFTYEAGVLSASAVSRRLFDVTGGSFTRAGTAGECAADAALTVESRDGRVYALLCDGMGSGERAASASALGISILSALLHANVERRVALALFNNAICASEEECSVALDLLTFDLYEGRAGFLKSGAAASFVFRDGALFRIRSRTIPLGLLRIVDSEEASFEARDGDVMVLLSDGVLGESEDGSWLKELLASDADAGTVARSIVETATLRETSSDDKTAVVLRVTAAKEN